MKYLVKTGLTMFWIMDIINLPFMQMFDTTYELNGLFWLLVAVFIGLFN